MRDAIIINGRVYELRQDVTSPCVNCALRQFCEDLDDTPICELHRDSDLDEGKSRYVEVEPSATKEVYLCILRHDDGRFKMICGCFYNRDAAERFAAGSPRITIEKINVI